MPMISYRCSQKKYKYKYVTLFQIDICHNDGENSRNISHQAIKPIKAKEIKPSWAE